MAKCSSCGKMKCSCGGMVERTKKRMGGMAMKRPGFPSAGPVSGGMTRPGVLSPRPVSGGMTRPGTMVKPVRTMMKKGGSASMGKGVRRKGSCGKNG